MTKIKISFKSKNQLPDLMIIKEFYDSGHVVWAEVLYIEDEQSSQLIIDGPITFRKFQGALI